MMQEKTQQATAGDNPSTQNTAVQQIAENPNPRANENSTHSSFEEKRETATGSDARTEITDGKAG